MDFHKLFTVVKTLDGKPILSQISSGFPSGVMLLLYYKIDCSYYEYRCANEHGEFDRSQFCGELDAIDRSKNRENVLREIHYRNEKE